MDMQIPSSEANKKSISSPLHTRINLSWQHIIILIIALSAVVSRLYILGARVMSHDEVNHVYFAYQFFNGGEYVHNPITHGPLQFHLLEWSYFLFGVSDFTARIPSAFFSFITILFILKFRTYLGKRGAIAAAILFIISPFMLYYGRYARNEAIAIFFSIATTWSVLRYLDHGDKKYLYLTAAFTALHFTTKETAFIFTAELMIFLGILFLYRVSRLEWRKPSLRNIFFILLLVTVVLIGIAVGTGLTPEAPSVDVLEGEIIPTPETPAAEDQAASPFTLYSILGAVAFFLIALIIVIIGFGWKNLARERAFGMILFQLTLVFPQLSAFPGFWLKLPVSDFNNVEVIQQVSLFTVLFLVISIILGGLWEPKKWLVAAGIYYGIFFLFYTSFFTNSGGVYSGLVGSLGYWLEQQGVERGSQPWYYFTLIQIPLYEYLALFGTLVSGIIAIRWATNRNKIIDTTKLMMVDPDSDQLSKDNSRRIALAMFLFFSVLNILAYTFVGEKMPWLTVHLTWPMWLVTGWLIGKLIEKINWASLSNVTRFWVFFSAFFSLFALFQAITIWVAPIPPFSGNEVPQLEATGEFLGYLVMLIAGVFALFRLTQSWISLDKTRFALFSFIMVLAALTTRHSALASYKNYDMPNEYLVYAHAARGPKDALEQIESISLRTTGAKDVQIGFDNHTAYPFWWYLRDYPNRFEFFENPTRELRNYPLILAGEQNYHLLDPIVRKDFITFEYPRMVWPNQDYFSLSFYQDYLKNPETRAPMLNALLQVWLNRDFSAYGEVTGQNVGIMGWNPSQRFRLYVRKDIASQIWQYGALADAIEIEADVYLTKKINLSPTYIFSDIGLNGPKGLAVGPDNTLYIADTGNNRIIHLSETNEILHTWGEGGAGAGEFNQPWGIAVDNDGFVYVADTWNHRIQKFTDDGQYILSWGEYGQAETPQQVWGPRGITIDFDGNVIITDTGNKRILVYSGKGEFIQEFGGVGYLEGQFDEPVGAAISPITNQLFIADTWNQRVQVFDNIDGLGYSPSLAWDIDGWYGQSLENKPFLTADTLNRVIIADPEAARVLVFSNNGEFLKTFGDYDPVGPTGFGLIGGVAADNFGGLWVSDSIKNEIKYFLIPNQETP
jgi:predicted membrane-bound mannosyltransferase/DNA-binding beta-propeller fold protein YncE